MNGTLGVIGGGFGAREFDRVDTAEVLDLVARRFQPHVLDAGNFCSHVLDAANRFFPVVIRHIVFEFVHDHVQHRSWQAEAVLHRRAARMQRARRDSRSEYHSAQDELCGASCSRCHLFLRYRNSASLCKVRWVRQLAATQERDRSPKWFDGGAAGPLRSQGRFIEGGMDWSGGESQERQSEPGALPPFPRIWIGCVYEYHVVLAQTTADAYSIKPLRAAWFHLIPLYGLYWVFKWPRELARFVNSRVETPLMRPDRTGLAVIMAFFVFLVLDRGVGMILLFWAASYLSRCLRYALAARPASPEAQLPFS